MPIPALNIIATHEMVLNSGFSSWAPRRIFPYRLKARYTEKARNPKEDKMNTQPKLGTRKLHKTASKTAARFSVKRIPHSTNTAERIAATQKTVRSILGPSDLCSTDLLPSLPLELLNFKHTLYLIPSWEAIDYVPDRATRFEPAPGAPPSAIETPWRRCSFLCYSQLRVLSFVQASERRR